jgi:enoyl-CoA hydratase
MAYETILVESRGPIGLITLNRPKALNALNAQLVAELTQALATFDRDPGIAVMVLTGSERAFAAGADIKEMEDKDFITAFQEDFIAPWQQVAACTKPVIAAVAGYALGGGCELAMMCDFIIAADNARFGQPEITIGTIPGFGGSQRLTWLVGKSKAMDMCLTGRMMDADEAERSGLVARVETLDRYLEVALEAAATIASFSRPVVSMAKQVVDMALETPLTQGIRSERQMFKATFALQDQKEGMAAFVEKRRPEFKHR